MAKEFIEQVEEDYDLTHSDDAIITLISFDHDAGEIFSKAGGDYIELLKWLEATNRNYPIHIHSMNIVGVQNMRTIIQHNGWKEIIDELPQ